MRPTPIADEISKYVARQIERFEAGERAGECRRSRAGVLAVCRRAAHHIDRALHDRFQFLARHLRAGTDRDGVDGRGGQLRQHLRDRRVSGSSPFSLASAEAGRERLVEFGKSLQHHGLRISGSDTASEAAVITVKQPRGPASPER